ncbi:hypothetical protein GOODEAATRI_004458 [Goodea atripinnis]|uniref:Uncharacterized protein n=1 Tax=Goodea atripinnis TaxID=208336 RepID=A0ABV0PKU5_9TELE
MIIGGDIPSVPPRISTYASKGRPLDQMPVLRLLTPFNAIDRGPQLMSEAEPGTSFQPLVFRTCSFSNDLTYMKIDEGWKVDEQSPFILTQGFQTLVHKG